jgi:branched-chain amino acid transport system ATP-binding protein
MTAALSLRDVSVNYGAVPAVVGLELDIEPGEIVALIGANGAGKSTTLRAVSRMVPLASGSITVFGQDVTRRRQHELVSMGLAHVPEGRRILGPMTVIENLRLGAFARGWATKSADMHAALERVYALFPVLAERSTQRAGSLSGGEQQMLAIGRALMVEPRILLLDEPSLGLAPVMVDRIYAAIGEVARSALTVLIVEQNAAAVLDIADRACVLDSGRIAVSGAAAELRSSDVIRDLVVGGAL